MTTITVSLPNELADQMDSLTEAKGFATRSEFIRHLLRGYLDQELKLETFNKKELKLVRADLAGTGKYSEKFVNEVIEGLKQSSVYEG